MDLKAAYRIGFPTCHLLLFKSPSRQRVVCPISYEEAVEEERLLMVVLDDSEGAWEGLAG